MKPVRLNPNFDSFSSFSSAHVPLRTVFQGVVAEISLWNSTTLLEPCMSTVVVNAVYKYGPDWTLLKSSLNIPFSAVLLAELAELLQARSDPHPIHLSGRKTMWNDGPSAVCPLARSEP